jgi:hypothetical protein
MQFLNLSKKSSVEPALKVKTLEMLEWRAGRPGADFLIFNPGLFIVSGQTYHVKFSMFCRKMGRCKA